MKVLIVTETEASRRELKRKVERVGVLLETDIQVDACSPENLHELVFQNDPDFVFTTETHCLTRFTQHYQESMDRENTIYTFLVLSDKKYCKPESRSLSLHDPVWKVIPQSYEEELIAEEIRLIQTELKPNKIQVGEILAERFLVNYSLRLTGNLLSLHCQDLETDGYIDLHILVGQESPNPVQESQFRNLVYSLYGSENEALLKAGEYIRLENHISFTTEEAYKCVPLSDIIEYQKPLSEKKVIELLKQICSATAEFQKLIPSYTTPVPQDFLVSTGSSVSLFPVSQIHSGFNGGPTAEKLEKAKSTFRDPVSKNSPDSSAVYSIALLMAKLLKFPDDIPNYQGSTTVKIFTPILKAMMNKDVDKNDIVMKLLSENLFLSHKSRTKSLKVFLEELKKITFDEHGDITF
jgi:hypothetical protein